MNEKKKKQLTNQQKGRLAILVTFLLVVIALVSGVTIGSSNISPAAFFEAWAKGDTTASAYRIVIHSRLPRVLGALLAGSSLAVCGSILQAVLQNPLASPSVIGVNNGAGLLVLLCSALLPSRPSLLPLAAFLGALLTALAVFALAMGKSVSRVTLVLTGIAMSSILGAGMNCIMILYPDAYIGASTFLVGGLSAVTLKSLEAPVWYILIGLLLAMMMRRDMNIVSLGSDTARSLGMSVGRTRFLLVFTAAILAGAAVSFAGLISFVGLIIPHGFRFLIGNDNRYLVPSCIFAGGAFVILCDLVSRTAFAPYEVPVGILLSFLGGPFFIYLIIRSRRRVND
ncbi:MAG: iron ABC transporter permease [Lachnospiraceae bacterium]|nr:iron ABC transporter permease [Lachnospiraceae bacterium]